MSIAHHRKKQPEAVRRQLLEEAAMIALNEGLGALTLDAVARHAGVSKGGLLHHFPSKHALLEAMCDEFLQWLDSRIASLIQTDPIASGRFARAYLQVMASAEPCHTAQRWALLSVMLFAEPAMRQRWHEWVGRRLREDCNGEGSVTSWIVWLAADGLWLSERLGNPLPDQAARLAVIEALRASTLPAPGCATTPGQATDAAGGTLDTVLATATSTTSSGHA